MVWAGVKLGFWLGLPQPWQEFFVFFLMGLFETEKFSHAFHSATSSAFFDVHPNVPSKQWPESFFTKPLSFGHFLTTQREGDMQESSELIDFLFAALAWWSLMRGFNIADISPHWESKLSSKKKLVVVLLVFNFILYPSPGQPRLSSRRRTITYTINLATFQKALCAEKSSSKWKTHLAAGKRWKTNQTTILLASFLWLSNKKKRISITIKSNQTTPPWITPPEPEQQQVGKKNSALQTLVRKSTWVNG